MKKDFILFFVFMAITGFLIYSGSSVPDKNSLDYGGNSSVLIAGQKIKVELADTPTLHAQGLSGREGLKEDEGMLFIFENPGVYSFWMKDMKFAIDIIWLAPSEIGGDGTEMKVIYIKKDARPASPELQRGEPESYLEVYTPDANAIYVLEVASGFSEKNNLKVGDRVEISAE